MSWAARTLGQYMVTGWLPEHEGAARAQARATAEDGATATADDATAADSGDAVDAESV